MSSCDDASMSSSATVLPGAEPFEHEPMPDSYHAVTHDNDARTILEGSARFIAEHASAAGYR
jgi:hypothetical protein